MASDQWDIFGGAAPLQGMIDIVRGYGTFHRRFR